MQTSRQTTKGKQRRRHLNGQNKGKTLQCHALLKPHPIQVNRDTWPWCCDLCPSGRWEHNILLKGLCIVSHRALLYGNIDSWQYWQFAISTIGNIDSWHYRQLALSTFGNIDSWQYWQLTLLTVGNINSWHYWQLAILTVGNNDSWHHWQLPILTVANIDSWQYQQLAISTAGNINSWQYRQLAKEKLDCWPCCPS